MINNYNRLREFTLFAIEFNTRLFAMFYKSTISY